MRDLYLAEGLWPDARPGGRLRLPGPSGTPPIVIEPGTPHLRRVNLTARIEQLPPGPRGFELDGVPDQAAAIEAALACIEAQGWRSAAGAAGWAIRCR